MGYGVAASGAAREMMRTMGNSGAAILSKIDEFIFKTAIRRATILSIVIGVGVASLWLFYIFINHKLKRILENIEANDQICLLSHLSRGVDKGYMRQIGKIKINAPSPSFVSLCSNLVSVHTRGNFVQRKSVPKDEQPVCTSFFQTVTWGNHYLPSFTWIYKTTKILLK